MILILRWELMFLHLISEKSAIQTAKSAKRMVNSTNKSNADTDG